MKTRIQKWGNSLALRIPRAFADEVRLKENSSVELSVIDGKIVLDPLPEKGLTLEDLLEKVTDENIHHEVDTGAPVGIKAW